MAVKRSSIRESDTQDPAPDRELPIPPVDPPVDPPPPPDPAEASRPLPRIDTI